MKRPSFQFYPGDWLNDAALRACSVGARGLWMDLLCLMHQGSDYGYLKVNHNPILPSNLARMLGATIEDVQGWLDELESFGVFSRDEDGCILSRRMIRDENIRQSRAAGGSLGGNPALKGKKKVVQKVNHQDNLEPTPSSSSTSSSTSSTVTDVTEKAPAALSAKDLVADGLTTETAAEWLAHRKRVKAPMTPRSWDGIKKQAVLAGIPLEDAVLMSLRNGWRGFEADWVKGRTPFARQPSAHTGFATKNYSEGINDDGTFD